MRGVRNIRNIFRKQYGTLRRRFIVRRYDERRILFDLGQAARGATNINELYELTVKEMATALGTPHVAIFVRDEKTGDYVCRVSGVSLASRQGTGHSSDGPEQFAKARNYVLAKDALVVKRLRNLSAPMSIAMRDLETWQRALATSEPARRERRERECATLCAIESRLLLGIMIQGRLVGILSLGPRYHGGSGGREFSEDDKRMLMSVASQLAFIIENAKLAERMVSAEGLRRELALAREVQQRLLPEVPPVLPGLSLSGYCRPARAIGGDYYDFLQVGEDQTGVAIADVAGKGIGAALLMSNVQASLRSQLMARGAAAGDDNALAGLVQTMNRLVYQSTGAASYVTFFYAQFDNRARVLSYVNAGHNPPLLFRATAPRRTAKPPVETKHVLSLTPRLSGVIVNRRVDAARMPAVRSNILMVATAEPGFSGTDDAASNFEIKELRAGGPVLGVFEEWNYEQETIQMQSGDLLVAYTDGLTEALNTEGEEFGEERLRGALAACADLPVEEVRERIVERVREWSAGTAQHDDLTFVVLKVE